MRARSWGGVGIVVLVGCHTPPPNTGTNVTTPKKPLTATVVRDDTRIRDDSRRDFEDLLGTGPTNDDIADEADPSGAGPAEAAPPPVGAARAGGEGGDTGTFGDGHGEPERKAADWSAELEANKDEAKKEDTKGGDDRKKKKARPRAATTTSAGGHLSEEQVDGVVSSHSDLFSNCSNVEALVTIRATVGADGSVMEVSAARSTPDDAKMRDCVTGVFRKLAFPRVEADWPSRLAFDLRLAPK